VAQPQVRENLPGLELDFLRNALGMTPGPPRRQLGPAQKIT
jgi:hypothetical protein